MLGHMLERLLKGDMRCSGILVATSDRAEDDGIEACCTALGVPCFRGPLADVTERFRLTATAAGAQAFVRLNGDSPLLDPRVVAQAVRLFAAADADVVTNTFHRSFPKGQSVEVVRLEAFQRMCEQATEDADREHVTRYFYQHPHEFRIVNFTSGHDWSKVQLSVDTPEDFSLAEQIVAALGEHSLTADLEEIMIARAAIIGTTPPGSTHA